MSANARSQPTRRSRPARAGRLRLSAAARRRAVAFVLAVVALGVVLGLVFAGSPTRIAPGVRIAGVDVGGMTPAAARKELETRAASLANVPVVFRAAGHTWQLRPSTFGVQVDWASAVEAARREGGGFGPFRGYRRLGVRVFGAQVMPSATVYDSALEYELARVARVVDRPHHEASIVLHGLQPTIVPGHTGAELDRAAAAPLIAHALAGFARGAPVTLPVKVDAPSVTAADLQPVEQQVRTVLSAPVRLQLGPTRWRLPRWRLAGILALPSGGKTTLRIGGPGADRWFSRLERVVDRSPQDASFAVSSNRIRIVPSKPGLGLNVTRSAGSILAAASQPNTPRVAQLTVSTTQADRSTKDAQAMGITGVVGSYTTFYGGEPNRIHNVELVARLIDNQLIAPGSVFSFNGATGARTAAKGFLEAPVIINGELSTGLGGGVCQVSTTVFNAAYEAGLSITARTNHALYISHYPLGRDATVNYPDTDLKFLNDTGHWLLLRTFVGPSSLEVDLYGTPQHRRVVSDAAPLVVTGQPPVVKTPDPDLARGQTIIDDAGTPSQATHVRRRVYTADGKLLYDTTWYSNYRSTPELVRVGTQAPAPPPTDTTTTGTTTGTTTTGTTTDTTTTGTTATTTTGTTATAPTTTDSSTTTVPADGGPPPR